MIDHERVEHLIVGAGMAGLTAYHFLGSVDAVIVDPSPASYKIGEVLLAEHFAHPEMARLLPLARSLPSFSPKRGSVFVDSHSVASFPLSRVEAEMAMHVRREELEELMIREWNVPVRRERVRGVDAEHGVVETDRRTYRVDSQILDCSGPAMVVARALGAVERLWPVYSGWMYFDIEEVDDACWQQAVARGGKRELAIDAGLGRALDVQTVPPSELTHLVHVDEGTWCWQVPLYGKRLLSFGLTSREKVTPERVRQVAETHAAPQFRIRPRAADESSPYGRFHVRNHFARRADYAAAERWALVGDAFFFGDPIYATGTTIAVNQAIAVAHAIRDLRWNDVARAHYDERCQALAKAAAQAHYLAPSSPAEARRQPAVPLPGATEFQRAMTWSYGTVLAATKAFLPDADSTHLRSRFSNPAWSRADRRADVARQLAALPGGTPSQWAVESAYPVEDGLHVVWRHPELPQLTMVLRSDDPERPEYRRAAGIGMSFMNLMDGPYPFCREVEHLFETVEEAVRHAPERWRSLWNTRGDHDH